MPSILMRAAHGMAAPFRISPVSLVCALACQGTLLTGALAQSIPADAANNPAANTAATAELPAVTVFGSTRKADLEKNVSNGALGRRPVLDTPFSIRSVSAQEIEERQVSDLNGIFAYDASASANNSGRQSQNGAILKIRGLTLTPLDNYKIDGLAFPNWFLDLAPEHFENVELLKGLGGFAYGLGAPAGMVNYVTKRPTAVPVRSIEVGYKSDSIYSAHVDLGGRVLDDRFGYRLNVVREQGRNFNDGEVDKTSASLSLDARLAPGLRLDFNGQYLDYQLDGFSGAIVEASNFSSTRTISGRTRTGVPGTYKGSNMALGTVGITWDLAPDWQWQTRYRNANFVMNNANIFQRIVNDAGDDLTYRSFSQRKFWYDTVESVVDGKVVTGDVTHRLLAGLSWQKVSQDDDRNVDSTTLIGSGNLGRDSTLTHSFVFNPSRYRLAEFEQKALFASDTLELGRWSLLAGARLLRYEQKGFNATGASTLAYSGTHVTPTFALTFKPHAGTSLYVSSVTHSIQAGGTSIQPSLSNYGQPFPPLTSKQYEAGIKADRAAWSAMAALFRVEKNAEYVYNNTLLQDGLVRHDGVEGSVAWRPARGLTLTGSATVLDAKYAKSATLQDKRVEGVARFQAAVWALYQLPSLPGVAVNAGARYNGSTYSDAANTHPLDAYTLLDLGASWRTDWNGHGLTLTGALRNVTDRQYWVAPGNSWLQPGEPRNVTLSAKLDF